MKNDVEHDPADREKADHRARIVARMASPAGIVNKRMAMAIATSSAISAARWVPDGTRGDQEEHVTTGIAAAMVDRTELPNGS